MNPLLAAVAFAAEPRLDGFVEVRGQGYLGVDGVPAQLVERLRPEFAAPVGERLALSATVEAAFAQGRSTPEELDRVLDDAGLGGAYAAPAWDNDALRVSAAGDYLSVERLYADAYLPFADVRVGRQAVNWGSALLVNPTDPFPEVLATEPWRPRRGVNAIRATVPFGEGRQAQAVVGSDDAFEHLRVAGRATANVLDTTDVSVVGAWRQEAGDGLVGAEVRGTLGVGFWAEAALHLAEEPYEEVAAGIDYSFPVLDALVVQAQYYRNGAGEPDADPLAALTADRDAFAPVFRGRDYAMAGVSLAVRPEVSATVLWVQNLGDGSALAAPAVTTFPTEWLEVSASGQLPLSAWGDGGELHPADADLVLSTPQADIGLSGLVPDATFTLWTRASF